MNKSLQSKIDYSIDLLQKAEPLALKMHPDGFYLAFSGGKDSQALYHIAVKAGVKFKAHMQITTLDPPELMHFVRTRYPDVELNRPEINFYNLIIKMGMLPLRQVRYCCSYLKEQKGAGTVTLIGIRAAESNRRAKRNIIENTKREKFQSWDQFNRERETSVDCINGKDTIIISPIHRWSDSDVWNFIRSEGLEYCKLYDEGFRRIGCLFCPFADVKSKQLQRLRYPGVEKALKRSIQVLINEKGYGAEYDLTADQIFDWYISNKSLKRYIGSLSQLKMNFIDEQKCDLK